MMMEFRDKYTRYDVEDLLMTLDAIKVLEKSYTPSRLTPISRPKYPLGHVEKSEREEEHEKQRKRSSQYPLNGRNVRRRLHTI